MDQFSLALDEDKDSLFGSPPPPPARGRSPSPETFVAGEEICIPTADSGRGVTRKNVGTIALPGSHMSCAELPADLPTSGLPRPLSNAPSGMAAVPMLIPTSGFSRPPTRSASSKASSVPTTVPVSTSTGKRRTSKPKSITPISPSPPITLPGPNEPTPPNFLRSQSSLLGLAGLVGSVKPAQLYTNGLQYKSVQIRSHPPTCGSTSTHPIVLDEDQDTPHIGRCLQRLQMSQQLGRLDLETLRSNIMNSLAKEKDNFSFLEPLIKLSERQSHSNSLPQPFARPYGHGIFNVLPSSIVSTAPPVPPPKRRKLKHVPAGAADWDVPFPFAAGEGPKAYRETWARDKAKQIVTQLLELTQDATKRATIKSVKKGGVALKGMPRVRNCQPYRSMSVERQIRQTSSSQASIYEYHDQSMNIAGIRSSMDSLGHCVSSFETPSASSSDDPIPVDPKITVEQCGLAAPCDFSPLEQWFLQLREFAPLETNAHTPESDWSVGISPSVSSVSSASSYIPDSHVPMRHATQDKAIDPVLLEISQQSGPPILSMSSAPSIDNISQVEDIFPTQPELAHSPRTLSSLTESLSSLSEPFVGVPSSMVAHQNPIHGPPVCQSIEGCDTLQLADGAQAVMVSSVLTEPNESSSTTAAQRGKMWVNDGVTSATSSSLCRSTPGLIFTSKSQYDRQAIVNRARERRSQLVAKVKQAKIEIWETAIENAVLTYFMREK